MVALLTTGCSTLRDSLIVGAGTGLASGAAAGAAREDGDKTENTLKGAVIGAAIGGLASYMIYGSLEKRDSNVRRETLMNLEHYEVMGFENAKTESAQQGKSKCMTTQEVDGKIVSIPCHLVRDDDQSEAEE